jgi:hypothetical protein
MATTRTPLSGRRGWATVAGLTTVLSVLVAGQLPAAGSDAPLAPVGSALRVLAPALAPSPGAAPEQLPVTTPAAATAVRPVTTSAADRLPGPIRPAPLLPPPAPAAAPKPTPEPAADLCAGEGWQQRRGAAALASLKAGAERTGFRVEFKAARKGYLGLTHLGERRIELFVRACGTQSDELLRHVMAHELGHAYDTTHNTAAERRAWQQARGIPLRTPWYGCSGCTDFATPAGDFAEVYAQWARGSSTNRSELAGDVPPAQLAALAQQFFGA